MAKSTGRFLKEIEVKFLQDLVEFFSLPELELGKLIPYETEYYKSKVFGNIELSKYVCRVPVGTDKFPLFGSTNGGAFKFKLGTPGVIPHEFSGKLARGITVDMEGIFGTHFQTLEDIIETFLKYVVKLQPNTTVRIIGNNFNYNKVIWLVIPDKNWEYVPFTSNYLKLLREAEQSQNIEFLKKDNEMRAEIEVGKHNFDLEKSNV